MTTNLIACIIVLAIGIFLFSMGIYQLILSRKEEPRAFYRNTFFFVLE